MMQFIVLLLVGLAIVGLYFLNKKKSNFDCGKLLKVLAVVYFLLCFFKMFFADGFIWVINGGFYAETLFERSDVLQTVLRWAMYFSSGVLTVACFTKVKLFKNIAIYFCLPLTLFSLFYFGDFMAYYMDGTGRGLKVSELLRTIILGAEFFLAIIIPLALRFVQKFKFDVKNKKEWLVFALLTPILAFSMFPVYTVQSLFGETSLLVGPFTLINYVWIALTVAIILVLVKIFKHRAYEQKFALCLWLCIILFMHYNSLYLMGFSIKRLPIQLCNLGAYFFLICMVFKSKRLFDFAFVANIVGTIIAMLAPDIDGGFGYFWNIHFMLEHMLVLIVPSVMMGVGLFPRINKSSFKNIAYGFLIYFGFCLVSGVILNAVSPMTGEEVNYFYLFDSELIFQLLPSMKFILAVHFTINGFIFYPVYILGVFVVYSFAMWLFYMLVQKLYKVTDDREIIWANSNKFKNDMKVLLKQRSKKC